MSELPDFAATMGPPSPAAPPGLHFTNVASEDIWNMLYETTGSGWYMNRFFYLFGEGLEALQPCLDAWSFLIPPGPERMILGRNAYGVLFVLENPNEPGSTSRVRILDPLQLSWHQNPQLDFMGLIGYWFPNKALPPSVLETRVYEEWLQRLGHPLHPDHILGIKVPLALGGKMEPDNFQIEDIVSYYRTTAPIYEKALRLAGKGP